MNAEREASHELRISITQGFAGGSSGDFLEQAQLNQISQHYE